MRLTEIRQRDERLHLTEAKLRDEKLREERAHEDELRKDRLHEARLREEKLREDRQRLAQKKWRNEHQISYHERKHYGRERRRESHQVATGSNKPIRLSKKQLAEFRKVRAKVMAKLMHQLGKPYLWGGTSPKTGFDCSGLVWFAYKNQVKYSLPRTANEMFHFRDAKPVSRNRLQKGDLVFFHIKGHLGADHVGVYLGNGKFIQSPRTGEDIHISKLADNYWQRHYIGARRIMTPMTVR
ncbi:NlpC/P60 family protein [Izhakiella capsodis]|nr:C40 family peptidase [Izhakiella capsodis]